MHINIKKQFPFNVSQTRSPWLERLWGSGGGWSEEGTVPSPRTVLSGGEAARTSAASRLRGRRAGWSSTGAPPGRANATTEPRRGPWEVRAASSIHTRTQIQDSKTSSHGFSAPTERVLSPTFVFVSFSFIRGSAFAPVHPFPLQRSKGAQPGLTATAAERSWMLSLILEPAEGTRAGSARLIYKPGGNRIMRARRIKQIAPYKQDLFNSLWFIDSCIRCGSCVVFMCVCVQKQAEIISTLFDVTMYLLCPCFNTRFT